MKSDLKAEVKNLNFFYHQQQVLTDIKLPIYQNHILALIGPSGCGKSTLLRCFNRMYELHSHHRVSGSITLYPDQCDILNSQLDAISIRMRVGMVFQKPNPFPKTIYENIAFGLKIRGITNKSELRDRVEKALKDAAIWDEVKDKIHYLAMQLSGGQQQRLCIARALALDPEILLLDEPTSALDPIATHKIEDLIKSLKEHLTVIIVTHNMQQAMRIADHTALLYFGKLIEFAPTDSFFGQPQLELTQNYLKGAFG